MGSGRVLPGCSDRRLDDLRTGVGVVVRAGIMGILFTNVTGAKLDVELMDGLGPG